MIKLKTLMFEATGMTVYLLFGYPDEYSNSAQVVGVYASDAEAKKVGQTMEGSYVIPAIVGQPLTM